MLKPFVSWADVVVRWLRPRPPHLLPQAQAQEHPQGWLVLRRVQAQGESAKPEENGNGLLFSFANYSLTLKRAWLCLCTGILFSRKKCGTLRTKKKNKEFLLKCMCSIPVSRNCRNSVAGSAGFQLDGGERGRRRGGTARAGQGRRQRGKSSQGACWEMAALN